MRAPPTYRETYAHGLTNSDPLASPSPVVAAIRTEWLGLGEGGLRSDEYRNGELFLAASLCVRREGDGGHPPSTAPDGLPEGWPLRPDLWRGGSEEANLVRAGALCLAERDRLMRITRELGSAVWGPADGDWDRWWPPHIKDLVERILAVLDPPHPAPAPAALAEGVPEPRSPDPASAAVPGSVGHHVPPRQLVPSLDHPATLRILPWITDAATDYLETFFGEQRRVGRETMALECGSGSSTGYLAQRVTRLVSFDHAADWHRAIQGALTAIGVTNVEWRTAERPYWRSFAVFPDGAFDVALVDGRDRTACVEHVRRLLAPGGILVVDNTERIGGIDGRGPYADMVRHLEGWPVVHFEQAWRDRAGWVAPHRWITSVWRKPIRGGPQAYTTLGLPL